eukprot:jgi/Mesvir1/16021/Mv08317-RA.1
MSSVYAGRAADRVGGRARMNAQRVARNYPRFWLTARDMNRVPWRPFGKTTVDDLRRFGKFRGLVLYRGLRKREAVRRRVCMRPRNAEDPITLEPLPPKERVFKFVRPDRRVAGFDAVKLAEYVVASGTFEDPVTRESLVAGMERMTGDVVEMMIDLSKYPTGEAAALLRSEYYPQFCSNFVQLSMVDVHAAECGRSGYIARVRDEMRRVAAEEESAAKTERTEFLRELAIMLSCDARVMRFVVTGGFYG